VVRRLALLDPIGDAGIGGYSHELAEALCRAGLDVDVYSTTRAFALRLPRRYALVPLFGAQPPDRQTLARLLHDARAHDAAPTVPPEPTATALDDYLDLLEQRQRRVSVVQSAPPMPSTRTARTRTPNAFGAADELRATDALVEHLCAESYDAVWTQWPDLHPFVRGLRDRCADAGMQVIHTVHNVLPHEREPHDAEQHRAVYAASHALVVHSHQAAASLTALAPEVRDRIVVARHGTYTLYPRVPGARERVRARLGIEHHTPMALVFGGVRPYKNVDALLASLQHERCRDVVLVVAGWEWGYDDQVPGDRLGRTRSLANRLGVIDRVRLLPGPFGIVQTAALFEASDVVPVTYRASDGSGVLCLGVTFQRHLLCTRSGGMHEHLQDYVAHTIAASPHVHDVARGLWTSIEQVRARRAAPEVPTALLWDTIVAGLLPTLASLGARASAIA